MSDGYTCIQFSPAEELDHKLDASLSFCARPRYKLKILQSVTLPDFPLCQKSGYSALPNHRGTSHLGSSCSDLTLFGFRYISHVYTQSYLGRDKRLRGRGRSIITDPNAMTKDNVEHVGTALFVVDWDSCSGFMAVFPAHR
ncbi:uncharacterized protein ARMOST_17652 [Armillaria ostoyae]|uniref:Uncharacterized protein n=1 Tax=Armillaria ostoyae TaxID=47428 RepID=A0A284RZQ9_ARMOS|nr:uncharacterized protein ARMOST_17652 [Armillaria ostoyae]